MTNIISAASDAFINPDSPWYYIVGVICLVLVFAALAVYIVVSGKRRKAKEKREAEAKAATEVEPTEQSDDNGNTTAPAPSSENDEPAPAPSAVAADSDSVETVPTETAEQEPDATDETPVETIKEPAEPEQDKGETAEKAEQTEETAAKPVETEKEQPQAPVANDVVAEKPVEKKPKTAAAKPKKAVKPFIDRLIAAKNQHSVYNELKNTVLSYPGIKAKITKEEETFLFGTEKKAALALGEDSIELRLYIDPATAPKQLGAEKSDDAELPTRLTVTETNIDGAQKLIIYAMNVALLTRNDRHRRVDYVKNAIAAKAKAKKK